MFHSQLFESIIISLIDITAFILGIIALLQFRKPRKTKKRIRPKKSRYIPDDVRDFVKERANGQCEYCGIRIRRSGEIEHIVAFSKGGSNYHSNLAYVCFECNRSKGDKDLREWALELPHQKKQIVIRRLKKLIKVVK